MIDITSSSSKESAPTLTPTLITPTFNPTPTTEQHRQQLPLQLRPVIIAGAGPCGLVAALTLQQQGVPFVIYERASSVDKLCSNTGSGIDVAPTAVDILANKLQVDMSTAMLPYDSMYIGTMQDRPDQKPYVKYNLQDLPNAQDFGFSNRSELQKSLLTSLRKGLIVSSPKDDQFPEEEQEEKGMELSLDSILRCNTEVVEYENHDDHVVVTIRARKGDGDHSTSTVVGSVLLACDGIHSAIRKHMNRPNNTTNAKKKKLKDQKNYKEDEYNAIGQDVWWGKTEIVPGSKLEQELHKLQDQEQLTGTLALSFLGTAQNPGGFFSCYVSEHTHAWVYFTKSNNKNKNSNPTPTNDLVRRGGTVLTEEMKQRELIEPFLLTKKKKKKKNSSTTSSSSSSMNPMIQLFIQETVASDITRAGFYDRKQLYLPYVDGRVALLGDAAHPQSPVMGQGANMAMVDGYVIGRRLAAAFCTTSTTNTDADAAVHQALSDFDDKIRRKGVNKVIQEARFISKLAVTQNRLKDWFMKTILKVIPPSRVIELEVSGDITNKIFVATMERDLASEGRSHLVP